MKTTTVAILVGFGILSGTASALAQTNTLIVRPDDETQELLREASKDKWFNVESILSALLGGAIAAAAGAWLARYTHQLEVRQRQREDAEFADNVLRAIRRELEALGEIYDQGIGSDLKRLVEGQAFQVRLSLTENWFTVFEANAVHFGKLPSEVSRKIVAINTLMKGLIEDFRINNEYIARLAEAELAVRQCTADGNLAQRRDALRELAVAQAVKLRELDARVKDATKELYAMLDKLGIK